MALTTDDVLDAAAGILVEYGLADLTMRRLGEALGVRAGALYYHVPNKQSLLASLADRLVASVPAPRGEWRPGLGTWASDLRRVLLTTRDSAELVASARGMRLTEHDPLRGPTELLLSAGFLPADADAAASTLLHFVLGHVAEEQARLDWERFGKPDPTRGPTASAETFARGLSLILDGVAARCP